MVPSASVASFNSKFSVTYNTSGTEMQINKLFTSNETN